MDCQGADTTAPKDVTHAVIIDARRSESTWASSDGGPDLKRGAHNAGRSTFGTKVASQPRRRLV